MSASPTASLAALLRRVLAVLRVLESTLVVGLLLTIAALSAADIVMRNLFDSGLAWALPTVRVLVLWLALLGALYATRTNRHISVDVLTRALSARACALARTVTSLFAAAVCSVVAWHSVRFVHGSYAFGDTLLNEIPAWTIQSVIPLSFALIALRFLLHAAGYLLVHGYHPTAGPPS